MMVQFSNLFRLLLFLVLPLAGKSTRLSMDPFYVFPFCTPPLIAFGGLSLLIPNISDKVRQDNLEEEVFCMAKIGVEQSLGQVQEALREKGHDVIELKQESDAQNCDCCV